MCAGESEVICLCRREDCNTEISISSILETALEQGIWAALYIYLFFRMLKENSDREAQYQQTIKDLTNNVQSGIDSIQDHLKGIEESIISK